MVWGGGTCVHKVGDFPLITLPTSSSSCMSLTNNGSKDCMRRGTLVGRYRRTRTGLGFALVRLTGFGYGNGKGKGKISGP